MNMVPEFYYFGKTKACDAKPIFYFKRPDEKTFKIQGTNLDPEKINYHLWPMCNHIDYMWAKTSSKINFDTCCAICSLCSEFIPIIWFEQ